MAALRFLGMLNVAIWLGASVFALFGVGQAIASEELRMLLGPNYPYFSGAIAHLIAQRYYGLQLICAALAVAHVTAEWLYLGKYPQKFWLGLLLALGLAAALGALAVEPALHRWHDARYGLKTRPAQREAALHSFRAWQTAGRLVNLLSIAGLAVYLWRVANPPDSTRFVSAVKFRS